MTPHDDNALDRIIDDVAGRMTAGAPRGAFRARVIARLDDRRAWWLSPWAWSPAAAAAVVLVAVAIAVYRGGPAAPASREHAVLASRSIVTSLAMIPPTRSIEANAAAPAATSSAPRRVTTASAVALLAPSPLEVPSLAISAMTAGESIQVPELETIAPITVAPIGEPQGERR